MKRLLIVIGFCVMGARLSFGQDLMIHNIEFKENLVMIQYEVQDTVPARLYTVRAYSSTDNFLNPIRHVSGDVGHEVLPQGIRTLIWDPIAELGQNFDGNVSLELRARVYVPFIKIDWFDEIKTFKKKRTYTVTWAGGRSGNVLNFDLLNKHDEKVATFANVANVGHYDLEIPPEVKPGKNYRFRISDSKNPDEVVYTLRFVIKRKVPLIASILIPATVAAGTSYAINQLISREKEIEDPITPPKN